MADQPAPAPSKGKGLTRKIGPLPVWAYGVIAVGAYYWYTHYGPGASKQQQPAGGGGLKTYAPRITETITYRGQPGRKGKPGRKPKPPRAGTAQAPAAAPVAAANQPGGGVNPGGPDKRPGRRRKPPPAPPAPPPAAVPPGPEQVASADYTPPTGGAVNADTGQPVYWEWQHAHRGPEVPEPVAAYAPMTAGGIYDAASAGAAVAAG